MVAIGDKIPAYHVPNVGAGDIKLMALLLRDSNPIHFDLAAVASAGLGDREVNQGGTTIAYVMNMLELWTGDRSAIRNVSCSLRGNVFAGDDVALGGTVTDVAEGLATVDVWADVVGGKRVIVGTATVAAPFVAP